MSSPGSVEHQKSSIGVREIVYAVMEFHHEKALAERRGLALFPTYSNAIWHNFLYHLRKNTGNQHPELIAMVGEFDWDGPFPENRHAREALPMFATFFCAHVPDPPEHMVLWTKCPNPFREIPELAEVHAAVMLEAEKYYGLVTIHPLPF